MTGRISGEGGGGNRGQGVEEVGEQRSQSTVGPRLCFCPVTLVGDRTLKQPFSSGTWRQNHLLREGEEVVGRSEERGQLGGVSSGSENGSHWAVLGQSGSCQTTGSELGRGASKGQLQGAGDQKARQEVVRGAQVEGARRIWRVKYWIVTFQMWSCSRGPWMSVCYNRGGEGYCQNEEDPSQGVRQTSHRSQRRHWGDGGVGTGDGQTGAQVLNERISRSREEHRDLSGRRLRGSIFVQRWKKNV